uniref:Uncharacterized protein n=1 Tax=Anguilla anguilla TaxID=7936 RepID=A0A0E9TVB9_ANGAN
MPTAMIGSLFMEMTC